MDKEILSWLTTVPAADGNFQAHLVRADMETLEAALKSPGLSKLARQKINSKLERVRTKIIKDLCAAKEKQSGIKITVIGP